MIRPLRDLTIIWYLGVCQQMIRWSDHPITRCCGRFKTLVEPALLTDGLTRRFGDFTAVQDVNLHVETGQFYGFLGPNGAGKSTTIKMLTGLMAPTSGRMQILGLDLSTDLVDVKRQNGVVPEGMGLFDRLNGAEYLRFVGQMYGLDRKTT